MVDLLQHILPCPIPHQVGVAAFSLSQQPDHREFPSVQGHGLHHSPSFSACSQTSCFFSSTSARCRVSSVSSTTAVRAAIMML